MSRLKNIEFVYFLNRGMVSQVVTVTRDGPEPVEVGVGGEKRSFVGAELGSGIEQKFST